MDLILFGVQGSGKGTQGKILSEKFGLQYFEMGAELRSQIQSGTELGQRIKSTVESGNLVDDDTIMEVVEAFLQSVKPDQPILFDGIPRTMEQSNKLLSLLKSHDREAFAVLIKVSEEVAIQRLLDRARSDDNMDIIRRRIEHYHDQTVPVIKSFYKVDRLIEVDGEQAIEKVTAEMIEKVSYLFN